MFQEWFGTGTITLENKNRKATKRDWRDVYNWQVSKRNAVHTILRKVEPLLRVKRTKANFMLSSSTNQS